MVARKLTRLAQEAKDIWDSYNKKDGKNYGKKFEDNKPPKSKAEKGLTEKQGGKLFAEKTKLKKRDPEKYRDLTKSGLTRKKIKPEQGPYEGSNQFKFRGPSRSTKKLTKEQQDKLDKQRQKYGKKMDKAGRGEGSYKDGGMPMPKPKPKRTITKKQLDSLPRDMVDVLKQGVNKKTPLSSLPRDMIGVLKMLAKKQLTQDEERKLKKSAKTDSRIVKEDTPPKPKRKPTGPSPRRGKGLKGGGTFRVLKKGVVRGSYS